MNLVWQEVVKEVRMDLLTVGEVAVLLRVSEKCIYRKLPNIPGAFKVFGSWRFCKETLLADLKKQSAPKAKGQELTTVNRHGL